MPFTKQEKEAIQKGKTNIESLLLSRCRNLEDLIYYTEKDKKFISDCMNITKLKLGRIINNPRSEANKGHVIDFAKALGVQPAFLIVHFEDPDLQR